jgi:ABC-type phosphate/phosphonate transport system permease subunit
MITFLLIAIAYIIGFIAGLLALPLAIVLTNKRKNRKIHLNEDV